MKSFSELTSASHVNNADILAISQENSGTYSSKKTTVKEISDFANQNLAEEYDSTSSYAVGDYCIYESVLYKCTASTTGTFDNTKWTSVVVTDEMGSGGGGGTGGHTIIDENGTSMTARAGLQFVGANVSDDATNNKTIVDMSGGGVYIEKTLWEDANGLQFAPNNIQTITLSESLNKYDFIYVDISSVEDSGYHNQNILAVSSLYGENDGYNGVVCIGGNINHANSFAKVDNTHLKFMGFSSANPLIAWKVVGIKVSGDYYAPVIYSTEERIIGVWKDGRPLYQKTVDFGALPNNTTKTVSYNISDLDYFVKIQCVAHNQNGSRNIPFVDDANKSSDVLLDTIKSSGVLRIIAHTDLSSLTGDVTLQYVKSTDVAGSGSWTPQGVPAVHYSTDEQVIGTWINGETLYQKTLHISNVQFDSTGVYDLDLTSMGTDILIADNSCSYYTFSTYVRNFEKLVPEDGHIYCYGVANRPIADGYITIKYTKSS